MELIVFTSTAVLTWIYTRISRKIGIGQLIKKDGPDLHGYKEGTPTMGGIVFVSIFLVSSLSVKFDPFVVLSTLSFFFIGLLDDLVSILKKDAYGMSAKLKFSLQILVSTLLIFLFHHETHLKFGPFEIDLGSIYHLFAIFLLTGVANAVNLTDGLDGLAGWVFLTGAVPMYVLTLDRTILLISAAVLGFLLFNSKPASVFMGDCGALALGAYLASLSIRYKIELYLIFFGFIFLVETLSVIIQISSYKIRKKRVFKMAPLHHHFELSGWSEEKVVSVFSAVNFVASITLLGLIS